MCQTRIGHANLPMGSTADKPVGASSPAKVYSPALFAVKFQHMEQIPAAATSLVSKAAILYQKQAWQDRRRQEIEYSILSSLVIAS